ncbi:transcriptional regulator, TetR family [Paenibacillus curdlanolyticus YK9]|uniref:Transcriptional regulator, TetR family n=1 Tax=Paenibacillus curdlanolyticus YK9 TaxID=717606 RepID=E0IF07_9BACL|nr:TetR/AcrR family transcriptional regulator [Paenibacillus curdlanolyticus]EFM08783.1 transcriptional regulator, TetR family [Paenibacillus curdlanolyticus YK9]
MVRTKEFEPSAALEKALRLFWRKGYERTSINDLVLEMGINRGSIYDTFGDKHSLYLQCLARYSDTYISQTLGVLARQLPVIATLERLFSNVAELVHEDGCNWGCFMTNTSTELALHDAKVADLVTQNFERLEQAFAQFIEQGIHSGELRSDLDPQALGRYFTNAFSGLATLAKTNLPAPFFKDVVQSTLSILK